MKKTSKPDNRFDTLVAKLRKNGFSVHITKPSVATMRYRFASVKKNNIRAGFCDPNNGASYSYINGKIAFDHIKCFDKWSCCPFSLPLPKNEKEMEYLLKEMRWLGTEEGYNHSVHYPTPIVKYPLAVTQGEQ